MKINSNVTIITAALLGFVSTADATIIQYFWANTYNNPATLNATKDQAYTLGLLGVKVKAKFTGIGAGGEYGSSSSNTNEALPYFSAAKRLNPKWVIGLNVSQPFFANQKLPEDAITRFDATQTKVNAIDISPQISYQIKPNLALGLGFDAVDFHRFLVNFVQFSSPTVNTVNSTPSWAYGWNAGLFYTLTAKDFFSFYYYSGLSTDTFGTSSNGLATNNQLMLRGFPMPDTYIANYTRMLSDKWLAGIKLYYSIWQNLDRIDYGGVVINNNYSFPVMAKNTVALQLFTKYDVSETYSLLSGVLWDQGAYKNNTRTIGFSSSNFTAVFLGVNYKMTKELSLKGIGGYGAYPNTSIVNPFGFPTNGNLNLKGIIADLSVTYAI